MNNDINNFMLRGLYEQCIHIYYDTIDENIDPNINYNAYSDKQEAEIHSKINKEMHNKLIDMVSESYNKWLRVTMVSMITEDYTTPEAIYEELLKKYTKDAIDDTIKNVFLTVCDYLKQISLEAKEIKDEHAAKIEQEMHNTEGMTKH